MKPGSILIVILRVPLCARLVSGTVDGSGDLHLDLERKVRLEADAARRTAEAEDHFLRGMKLRKSQHHELSTEEFRRAEAVVLDAREEEYFETSLRGYLHELRSRIAAVAGAFSSAPNRSNPFPPTATDLSVFSVDPRTQAWVDRAVRRPILQEPLLRSIFREKGVPEDLIYVGLVESGFDTTAVSAAVAARFIVEENHHESSFVEFFVSFLRCRGIIRGGGPVSIQRPAPPYLEGLSGRLDNHRHRG
jgi:hypothetical protein